MYDKSAAQLIRESVDHWELPSFNALRPVSLNATTLS